MSENFWDKLMESDEGAASYMTSYGEGPGCETRMTISSFINDNETVLDVGCGPGINLEHFLQYGPKILNYKGVDYSPRFIRVCQKKYDSRRVFEVQDARHLEEPDESWDVVILQDVLDHTPGYEKPVTEAIRVANKRVIISFWRGVMTDDFEDRNEDVIRDDGNDGWTGEYSRKNWEKWLDSLGYFWHETQSSPKANRWHRFYVIDKKETI
jgi:ubiquinone/menaquinone biosynthesis C-methylase UbiE